MGQGREGGLWGWDWQVHLQSKLSFYSEGAQLSPAGSTPVALLMPLLPPPQAVVSNPHSVGLQAILYEDGYTYGGNTKHKLVSCTPPQTGINEIQGCGLDQPGQVQCP